MFQPETPAVAEPYAKDPVITVPPPVKVVDTGVLTEQNEAACEANEASAKLEEQVEIDAVEEAAAQEKAEEWKKENFNNCEVDSERVIQVLTSFVVVRKLVTAPARVDSAIRKLSRWIETSPGGGNDEEAANLFFLEQILDVLKWNQ